MFEEGKIIYFSPFYFKNGNTAKSKYFVVLKNTIVGDHVIASLPTSADHIPEKDMIDSGCIELPEINFNCFVISPNDEITICNKKFARRTHIYGNQIDLYERQLMEEIYPIEGTDYEIWGIMKPEIYKHLLNCLINSGTVKRKFVRLLQE